MTNHRRAIRARVCATLAAVLLISCSASEQQVADMAAQAQQLLEMGQIAKARELIDGAVRERDDMPAVFLVQARIALAQGRRDDAYGAFANALALDAANPEALMGVAQTGLDTDHVNDAADAADKILILIPDQPDALLVKGIATMVGNDLDGAITFSDKVLAVRPGDIGALILKSRVLALQGNHDDALALIGNGIARHGRTLELTMAMAELQRQGSDPETFLALLRRIKELAPGQRDYRFDLVDVLYRLGRVDEARAETASLIEEPSVDPRANDRYARLWYAYDPEALTPDQLVRVAAKAPVETRLAIARFYVETGRGKVAAALLRPIATGWSSDIQALYARAIGAPFGSPVWQAAGSDIVVRDPDNGDALLVKAVMAMTRKDPARAIASYQQVVHDYPKWEEGYLGLARAYAATDKPDSVRRAFESGRAVLPQSLPLARAYVATLLRMGDQQQACDVARRFAQNSPSLIAGWRLYAQVCARTGDEDCRLEAGRGLESARTRFGLDPEPGTPRPTALIGRLT